MSVAPNGEVHEVGLSDLFFSTTDHKGVILLANEVFVRLSRHPRQTLTGAPHNIIRHPDMPGGAFKLVWDMLKAGEPTCAYVKNLAGDGSTYWAFATIIPIDSGYLSVRSRPVRADLQQAVEAVYADVRARELQARAEGASAAAAAELGAELIEEALVGQGFTGYADFITVVLPAEMTARAAEVPEIESPPEATGARRVLVGSVLDILGRVGALEFELTSLQRENDELGDRVAHSVAIAADLAAALATASETAEDLREQAPLVANAVPPLTEMCDRIGRAMALLLPRLEEMRAARSNLIYSVAHAQLQAEMLVRHVIALVQKTEDSVVADRAIFTLSNALRDRLYGLTDALNQTVEHSRQAKVEVEEAAGTFERAHNLLNTWCALIDRHDLNEAMSAHLPDLEKGMDEGAQELAEVDRLAESIGRAAVSFDNDAVHTDFARMLSCLRLVV